jgi:hypothetical protein
MMFWLLQASVPEKPLRYGAAAIRRFGIYRLVRATPALGGDARVGFRDLTMWSFLMATARRWINGGAHFACVVQRWGLRSFTNGRDVAAQAIFQRPLSMVARYISGRRWCPQRWLFADGHAWLPVRI